jgi:curli biogenesis system outer membrane secretion channel CsgG
MACKASNCAGGQAAQNGLGAMLAMAQAAQGGGMPLNVSGIADGIKDVLVTALTESGCFEVQDRDQMDEIAQELARAGKQVQTTQADFLVSGAVTQIDVSQDNKSAGGLIGGLLSRAPLIGAVAANVGYKTQKAAVGLDMKLVDVNTAKVVASKRAQASTETSSFSLGGGAGALGAGGLGGFGGSLSSLKGTNLEAVTKDAIVQSVTFLVEAARAAKGTPAKVAANP